MSAVAVADEFCRDGLDCIRVVTVNNEPWMVVSDLCAALSIGNVSQAVKRLHRDDLITTEVIDSLGRTQRAWAVNESGFYDLLLDSRKPEAKTFRRWVTSEVLPSVRKTGRYETTPVLSDVPYLSAERLALLGEFGQALTSMTIELSTGRKELKAARPAVEFHDRFVQADGLYKVADVAKVLGIPGLGQNTLFEFLRSHRVLIRRGSSRNSPYQQHQALGRFEVKVTQYQRPDGRTVSSKTTYVTPKGLEYIAGLIDQHWSNR